MEQNPTDILLKSLAELPARITDRIQVMPSGCWEWQGARVKGYGQAVCWGKVWRVHRLAWSAARGPIPYGLDVLHHCDNPPCCNPAPDHLFVGTHVDNMADMAQKLRGSRGEAHMRARLTDVAVIDIRQSHGVDGVTDATLAARHGVDVRTVHYARIGRTWTHLPGAHAPVKYGELTAEGVLGLRRRYATGGHTHRGLAREMGVSATTVRRAILGITWQQLPMETS
ncbi:MAG: HNH endonuclease [Myxococcales bacterium]|nr:HNH endonuclease [Myxococcales bacterium]